MTDPLRAHAAVAAVGAALLFAGTCALPRVGLAHARLDTGVFRLYGERTLDGRLPYRDFSIEYPPGSLPAFVLPAIGPSHRFDVQFKLLEALFGALAVALVPVALLALRPSPSRLYVAAGLAGFGGLALGSVTLIRFDLWPTLLTAAALAALLHGRGRLGCGLLGLGTAAKLWPAVLVPLAAIYLVRARGRREGIAGVASWAVAAAVVVLPFAALAPGGVVYSLRYQLGRPLQVESVGGALLLALHQAGAYRPSLEFAHASWSLAGSLADGLGGLLSVLQAAIVVAIWLLFLRGRADREQLVVACVAAVAAFVAVGKVFSPQFLLWLVPAVPLLRRRWTAAPLFLAALLLTHAFYPSRYDDLIALDSLPTWLLVARDAVVLALVGVLAASLVREGARRAGSTP